MAHGAKATEPWIEEIDVDGRPYKIRVEREGRWFVGVCDDIPGWCGSQGETLDELRFMVADAIRECLLAQEQLPDAAKTTS